MIEKKYHEFPAQLLPDSHITLRFTWLRRSLHAHITLRFAQKRYRPGFARGHRDGGGDWVRRRKIFAYLARQQTLAGCESLRYLVHHSPARKRYRLRPNTLRLLVSASRWTIPSLWCGLLGLYAPLTACDTAANDIFIILCNSILPIRKNVK